MSRNKNQQAAYDKIGELVDHFASQVEAIKKKQKEAETRIMYINPLFDALGWDIDNTKLRLPISYKDVIHEDELKIGGKTKAPDYCFTNYGKRVFFLEAKKPAVHIKTDTDPSYQLRRYGWSAKLPISLLTDFEEFALYDCTKQPKETDSAAAGRLKYLTYEQYLSEFDWLWDLFSKDQVIKGSLDQFAKADKKGTQSVDYAFLQSLDEWRNLLATNIAIRNKELNEDEINYIVQMNINRIVFLRNCEDRGAEPYGKLKECLTNSKDEGGYFRNMHRLYDDADRKYNSGLFDFAKDSLSKFITVDNKVISTIVSELYYPKSPYEFSVIGAEILGTAYERFLGKVIRLTAGHQAKVEEKPEVRKAGGVFYTPQYIVEYIVKNTVGKLIEGMTPDQIEKVKICDPACGSGSFLLGAYQFLLNYHIDWYTKNYKKSRTASSSPLTPEGNLTTQIKKQILLNNIYGVDLDAQAVEVTKLSLLMKCMEGETAASMQTALTFERVLPTLDYNIKNGNSLIDFDFYSGQLDFGENKKVKPFNWRREFTQIFKNGGFDIIIGNPPYVFGRDWKALGIGNEFKEYYSRKFTKSPYQMDLFSIFMEQATKIVNPKGFISFIVPNVWLTNTYSSLTRNFIIENSQQLTLTLPPKKVFEKISVDTVIYISRNGLETPSDKITINKLDIYGNVENNSFINKEEYKDGKKPISTSLKNDSLNILEKIKLQGKHLSSFADITRGVHPYRTGGYGKSAFIDGYQIQKDVQERPYHSKDRKPNYREFIYGKNLKRFTPVMATEFIKYGNWLAEPRDPKFFQGERIYSRKILGKKLVLTIEKNDSIADQQVYITLPKKNFPHINYLSGILGSNLMAFYIRNYFDEANDEFPQIKVSQLKELPIKEILESKNDDLNLIHDKIVANVEKLITLNNKILSEPKNEHLEILKGKVLYIEEKINELVYLLYGLSKEEIKLVEHHIPL